MKNAGAWWRNEYFEESSMNGLVKPTAGPLRRKKRESVKMNRRDLLLQLINIIMHLPKMTTGHWLTFSSIAMSCHLYTAPKWLRIPSSSISLSFFFVSLFYENKKRKTYPYIYNVFIVNTERDKKMDTQPLSIDVGYHQRNYGCGSHPKRWGGTYHHQVLPKEERVGGWLRWTLLLSLSIKPASTHTHTHRP